MKKLLIFGGALLVLQLIGLVGYASNSSFECLNAFIDSNEFALLDADILFNSKDEIEEIMVFPCRF